MNTFEDNRSQASCMQLPLTRAMHCTDNYLEFTQKLSLHSEFTGSSTSITLSSSILGCRVHLVLGSAA